LNIDINLRDGMAERVLIILIACDLLLTAVYAGSEILKYTAGWNFDTLVMLDMDGEANLPSWYASMQLFCVGLLGFLMASRSRPGEPPSRLLYVLLGLAMIFFSFDEASKFHERLSGFLDPFESLPHFSYNRGRWLPLYVLVIVTLAVAIRRHIAALWRHHRTESRLLLTGSAVYAAGAVGLEVLSYELFTVRAATLGYSLAVAAEEFLEMLGVSLILYGVLRILLSGNRAASADFDGPRFHLDNDRPRSAV
jgi:hypothetical protein